MSVKPEAKNLHFNPCIYILYYQSNMPFNLIPSPACYSFKMIYFICNGVLEQPSSEILVYNVMAKR